MSASIFQEKRITSSVNVISAPSVDCLKLIRLGSAQRAAPTAGFVSSSPPVLTQGQDCALPKHPVSSPQMSITEAGHLQTVISLWLQENPRSLHWLQLDLSSPYDLDHSTSATCVIQTDYSYSIFLSGVPVSTVFQPCAQYHDRQLCYRQPNRKCGGDMDEGPCLYQSESNIFQKLLSDFTQMTSNQPLIHTHMCSHAIAGLMCTIQCCR